MSIELARRIEFFLSRPTPPLRTSQGGAGIAVGSIKGPREDNQDRAAVAFISLSSGESVLVGLVCDGMGGMAQGAEAAGCAASTFLSTVVAAQGSPLRQALHEAVSAANREVYRRFRGAGGTTLTAIALRSGGEAWVAHVGDSRLYEASKDKIPYLVTRDDTIGGQLKSPDGNADDILDNRLLQFVGIGASIEPHIFRVPGGSGKTYLITTDGAHSIGKRSLEGILRHSSSVPELVRKVLFVAEAVGVEDNSSAVAIAVSEFEAVRYAGHGTEVTIWSPSEKLEMWLERIGLSAPKRPQAPPKQINPPKEKKPAKAKQKQSKPLDAQPPKASGEAEKPQLNIEFGSNNEDTK